MTASLSSPLDIFEVYSNYCEIESKGGSRDEFAALLKSLGTSHTVFSDLSRLVACLDFSVDSHKFSRFYDFVFFICRENGQKNITVNKALYAWRLVLKGRFRLLDQWCDFVQKYQRHNISEDNWRQLLAFSRCVNEDLEGYDPKGAWPVLIDDFVDYMHRTDKSSCSTWDSCDCGTGYQYSISNTLRGLKLLPGCKRKSSQDIDEKEEEMSCSCGDDHNSLDVTLRCKRSRHMMDLDENLWTTNSTILMVETKSSRGSNPFAGGCINNSACAVEDCLAKSSNGHFDAACFFDYVKKSRV